MDMSIINDNESLELDNWVGGSDTLNEMLTDPCDFINNFIVDNEVT